MTAVGPSPVTVEQTLYAAELRRHAGDLVLVSLIWSEVLDGSVIAATTEHGRVFAAASTPAVELARLLRDVETAPAAVAISALEGGGS